MSIARSFQNRVAAEQSLRKRAAIYVRVSTAGQEQDGTSLGTQETACRLHADTCGYEVDEAHVYREVHTGTELWERRELHRLREAVRRREIDVLVVYAIDRLSRDPVHLGVVLSEADHAGVDVQFVSEPLDNSPEGQLIRFVRGYAAKVEHEKFRERSMRGRDARLASGKPLPGPRPIYGYRWRDDDKSGYELDPVTAPIVQRIFAEALAGKPLRKIAAGLTLDGIARPKATDIAAWRHSTVSDILAQRAYTGRLNGRRFLVVKDRKNDIRTHRIRPAEEQVRLPESVVPALIDDETFDAIQLRLQLNRQRSVRNNRAPDRALLRGGYVRCGHCDGILVAHSGGRRGQYLMYRCNRSHTSKHICDGSSISVPILDAAVWQRVERLLTRPDLIAAELARLREDDPTETDLEAISRRLAEITRRRANLVRRLSAIDDNLIAGAIETELSTLTEQQRRLEEERVQAEARRQSWQSANARLKDLQAWCATVAQNLGSLSYDQRRSALDALGVEVKVYRPGGPDRYVITASIPLAPSDCVRNPTQFRPHSGQQAVGSRQ